MKVSITVNGTKQEHEVEPRALLVSFIRDNADSPAPVSGATHRRVAPAPCCWTASRSNPAPSWRPKPTEHRSPPSRHWPPTVRCTRCRRRSARTTRWQCGFCTPGMVMAAISLLAEHPDASEADIRQGLEGNMCRCTGYHNIVKAVLAAAQAAKVPA